MTFGQRVQRARERRGLSQNQLAQRAGIPQPSLHRIESGVQVGAGVEVLKKLARALHVSTDYLCGMDEEIYQDTPRGP
jgi:transcriptional regulator with XRE-family HTH domain